MTIDSKLRQIQTPILKGGERTNVILATPREIDQLGSLADGMIVTINAAFKEQSSRTQILDTHQRMIKGSNFEQQLGDDPTTFCIIITKSKEPSFVAGTVAARRFSTSSLPIKRDSLILPEQGLTTRAIFTRTDVPSHHKNSIFWELKLLAVHPSMQGQRLGQWLMDTAEEEIKRRTLEEDSNANEVVIVLTTVDKHAGPLYLKRGYTIDGHQDYPAGTVNSENGFTVLHMYKRYEL